MHMFILNSSTTFSCSLLIKYRQEKQDDRKGSLTNCHVFIEKHVHSSSSAHLNSKVSLNLHDFAAHVFGQQSSHDFCISPTISILSILAMIWSNSSTHQSSVLHIKKVFWRSPSISSSTNSFSMIAKYSFMI